MPPALQEEVEALSRSGLGVGRRPSWAGAGTLSGGPSGDPEGGFIGEVRTVNQVADVGGGEVDGGHLIPQVSGCLNSCHCCKGGSVDSGFRE